MQQSVHIISEQAGIQGRVPVFVRTTVMQRNPHGERSRALENWYKTRELDLPLAHAAINAIAIGSRPQCRGRAGSAAAGALCLVGRPCNSG